MFGRHPTLAIDAYLELNSSLGSEYSSREYYVICSQGCGNSKNFLLVQGQVKNQMYLSIENFTCSKEKNSLYSTGIAMLLSNAT